MTNTQSLGYFDGFSDGVVWAVDKTKKILIDSNCNIDKDTCLYIENCLKELQELRRIRKRDKMIKGVAVIALIVLAILFILETM